MLIRSSIVLSLLTFAASTAHAQWTVTNLHPPATSESQALGVGQGPSGLRQVGYAVIAGAPHAMLWSGSAAGFTDLNPAGAAGSAAYAIDGAQQAGIAYSGSVPFAAIWSGSAATWQNLNPSASSTAYSLRGTVVVGQYATGPTTYAPCQWISGVRTALLNGFSVNATDGASHAGWARTGNFPIYGSRAVLWTGNPIASVSLHPAAGHYSTASGIHAGQQVGKVTIGSISGPVHASLWTGTAESWIDLHPAAASASECTAVFAGKQAGFASVPNPTDPLNTVTHASLWSGTAGSWVDLHAYLPASFLSSRAMGIWSDATSIYIVGYGANTLTNRNEALLWTYTPAPACATSDFNGDTEFGTDADIESFFACLADNCCPTCWHLGADFNADGDTGTDADIEAFFRVLAGGNC